MKFILEFLICGTEFFYLSNIYIGIKIILYEEWHFVHGFLFEGDRGGLIYVDNVSV